MTPILEIQNVSKKFADGTLAINGVSFSIMRGEFAVVAGQNGSGKSVLMSLIANLDSPTSGKIILNEGARSGLIFQDAESQILGETVEEDVAFGAKNCELKGELLSQKIDEVLSQVGLLEKKFIASRTMSGGEKRRLAVAGVLAMDFDILIFDEPFANLDWSGVRQVCALLSQLKNAGKTIIVLTHELEKILALCDKLIILEKGELRFFGTPQEGLLQDLERWNIRNPLVQYNRIEDLLWV